MREPSEGAAHCRLEHADQLLRYPLGFPGAPCLHRYNRGYVMEASGEDQDVGTVARVGDRHREGVRDGLPACPARHH